MGKKVFFITNNNDISRDNFLKKFDKFGMKVSKTEIYTAAFATAYYMKHIVKFDKKVYMIGGKGLSEELTAVGIPNIGYGRDDVKDDFNIQYDVDFNLDPEVGAVVSGYDKFISINKLIKASSYLARDSSCLFVATNPDDRMPVPKSKDYIIPGIVS
ncbi:phosphoglycolate phosphatase 1B, chloroplastic [Exaiptasia diaphana]|uniref:Uncharacterized protein n=1 Tax=Exaiptasia diaphana TaxID=2652724 RepID=A0A913WZH0_EXADI|nr:phosphoglycolate phosphatase 1B, chloroplastic [Exaiptasia diaphana]KXJ16538.1 4-nitrophenylphosphatase [Exaiptasia diaphana]